MSGQLLSLLAGGLACLSEGDLRYLEIDTGMMVFGEDALADGTGLIDSTFGEQDNDLTKLSIRSLGDEER